VIVVDASLALAWLLDETRAAEADAALFEAVTESVVVPPLFWLEVANALRTRLRRSLIDEAFRNAALTRVRALGIVTADGADVGDGVLDRTIALSDRFELTVYDAAYLELALRLGAPLLTFDDALARAASAAGAAL
jgi:predicted nucleic acid-binding protein